MSENDNDRREREGRTKETQVQGHKLSVIVLYPGRARFPLAQTRPLRERSLLTGFAAQGRVEEKKNRC